MTQIGMFRCQHHGLTEYYMRGDNKRGDCKKCVRERVERQREAGNRYGYESPEKIARRQIRQQQRAIVADAIASPQISVHVGTGLGRILSFDHTASAGGCLFIDGHPTEALRAGLDPHCGKKRKAGSPYCEKHNAICYVPPKTRATPEPSEVG